MDPNACLDEIRKLIGILQDEYVHREPANLREHLTLDLIDSVNALDGWISNGGFPPDAWKPVPLTEV